MKHINIKKFNFLTLLLLLLCISPVIVHADSISIPITKVDDISTYTDYIPNNISYSSQFITTEQILELKLDRPSSLLISLTGIDVYDYNSKSSARLNVTIYKEKELLNKLYNLGNSSSATMYKGVYYMDPGTYYVRISPPSQACYGSYKIGVIAQDSISSEIQIPSNKMNPNSIAVNSEFYGFLSETNTTDYYVFALDSSKLIDLSIYRLDGTGSATLQLLDSNYSKIQQLNISSQFGENKLTKFLLKGTYYIKVENSSSSGGGNYKAVINAENYKIDVSKSTTKKTNTSIELYFDTNFNIYSGRLINANDYKVTAENMADNTTWRQGTSISSSATVSENGTYYIVLKDRDGYAVYTKYKVSNIDKNPPKAANITYCKLGGTKVSGTGEKSSTVIIYVLYNGRTSQYQGKVNNKGKFSVKTSKLLRGSEVTIYIIDAAGNQSVEKVINIK